MQTARIKLGQAGATAVSFRGSRLAVTPVELDSTRAKRFRAEIPEALYEPGQLAAVDAGLGRGLGAFDAVVRAADVLLAITGIQMVLRWEKPRAS